MKGACQVNFLCHLVLSFLDFRTDIFFNLYSITYSESDGITFFMV